MLDDELMYISKLVEKALGTEVPYESDIWYFDLNGISSKDNQENIAKYRLRTGRKYPPVYKVKFVVDAEEISLEDAEEYWKKHEWDSSKFDDNGKLK